MNETVVVNKNFQPCDVYIGRTLMSPFHFGNPFTHTPGRVGDIIVVKDRDTAVFYFQRWLEGLMFVDHEPERRMWILENMESLRGKRLGCFCKPKPCHGDVYVRMLEMKK